MVEIKFDTLQAAYDSVRDSAFHALTKEELLENEIPKYVARIEPLARWILAIGREYQRCYSDESHRVQAKVTELKSNGFGPYVGTFFDETQDNEIFPTFSLITAYSVAILKEKKELSDAGKRLCEAMNLLEECFEQRKTAEAEHLLMNFSEKFVAFLEEMEKHTEYKQVILNSSS